MGLSIDYINCPKCEDSRAVKTVNASTLEVVEIICHACGFQTEKAIRFITSKAGKQIGSPIEADSKGEAAILILEEMGFTFKVEEGL